MCGVAVLDFSACRSRAALYALLREEMDWKDWYGENLDALYDVLTGLPHEGRRFRLIPPGAEAGEALCGYARRMEGVFRKAGALDE